MIICAIILCLVFMGFGYVLSLLISFNKNEDSRVGEYKNGDIVNGKKIYRTWDAKASRIGEFASSDELKTGNYIYPYVEYPHWDTDSILKVNDPYKIDVDKAQPCLLDEFWLICFGASKLDKYSWMLGEYTIEFTNIGCDILNSTGFLEKFNGYVHCFQNVYFKYSGMMPQLKPEIEKDFIKLYRKQ